MWRVVDRFFERLCGLAGAVLLSQAPTFMQQYIQNLQGRVAELKVQVDQLTTIAAQFHKTVPEYIGKFLSSSDPEFVAQGNLLKALFDRYSHIQTALQALQGTSVWQKPFALVANLQWDVAKSAFQQSSPALPLTLEGIIYSVVGFILGVIFYRMVCGVFKVRKFAHARSN